MSAGTVSSSPFGTTAAGHAVEAYTLTSPTGAAATILTYGATLQRLLVPDGAGNVSEVTLGFDDLEGYETRSPFFGATVGRVANRIAGGRFTLDGKTYELATNNGPNHLHGGLKGYDKRIWAAEALADDAAPGVRLTLVDPDGMENYPGTVRAAVTFRLLGNTLRIEYEATTDRATPINLTNHTYFNLKDAGKSDVLAHGVRMNADRYTPVDATLIPTGEIAPVAGTPFDFRSGKAIGRDLAATGGSPVGYDHNFVLNRADGKGSLEHAVTVEEATTRRRMEVFTTQPGVQFYTGNFLDGSLAGRGGTMYGRHHGFCLETQHFPDAVNQRNFPSVILRPGQVYREATEFRFSVMG